MNEKDELESLQERVKAIESRLRLLGYPFITREPPLLSDSTSPFMQYSTCSATDFCHPRYQEILNLLHIPFDWHRKLWEWVFIYHHLTQSGAAKPGSHGLVFGVASERLPAVFAKLGCQIVATDAPAEIGIEKGWAETGQHNNGLASLHYPEMVDSDMLDARVSYQACDMNEIPEDLEGFDFNWSSCCFEHLGSLEAGMDFVVNAVEKTLRIGGVAVHTTEYNVGSNDETVEKGGTVIYRRRDMEELVRRLQERGHKVKPFTVAPALHYYDFHVDVPPYAGPHLKLALLHFITTSAGIVVERGK